MVVIIQRPLIIRTQCSICIRHECAYQPRANCFHCKTRKDKRFKWFREFHCVKPVRISYFLFLCFRISTDSGDTWPNAQKSSYAVEQKIVHIWTLINIKHQSRLKYYKVLLFQMWYFGHTGWSRFQTNENRSNQCGRNITFWIIKLLQYF